MLDKVTPVILTYNESPNICRTLDQLGWANDIVVVDSMSSDDTIDLVKQYSQVRVFQRRFDKHADQWNYAISETCIKTEWILALDADYILSDDCVDEIRRLNPGPLCSGYKAPFRYCVFGRPLRSALYAPVSVLFKKAEASYVQDGHTQRLVVSGQIRSLESVIFHDDRKHLSHWLQAQDRYMVLEAEVITNRLWRDLSLSDKLRKLIVISPPVIFFYCLVVKGGAMDGWHGLYYAVQRVIAELILSVKLIEKMIRSE